MGNMIDTIENLRASFWDMGSESAVNDCGFPVSRTAAGIISSFQDVISSECAECRIPGEYHNAMARAFAHGYLATIHVIEGRGHAE